MVATVGYDVTLEDTVGYDEVPKTGYDVVPIAGNAGADTVGYDVTLPTAAGLCVQSHLSGQMSRTIRCITRIGWGSFRVMGENKNSQNRGKSHSPQREKACKFLGRLCFGTSAQCTPPPTR